MAATADKFPRELVNVIIDELAGDRTSLLACSLTSPIFCEMTRKHIFREITVSFDARKPSRAELLSQILQANPVLSSLVEILILHIDHLGSAQQNLALFAAFPNVKRLTLGARREYTDWQGITDTLRDALSTLMQRPSLKSLALNRQSNFPIDFLLRFPNITRLSIEASSSERQLPTDEVTKSPPPIPQLCSLSAVIYGDNGISLSAVQDAFRIFASSLTDVTLDYLGYEDRLPPPDMERILSFRGFDKLASLKLILRIHGSTMSLLPFRQSLETLSESKNISLEIYIRYLNEIGEPYIEHWNALDRELCRLFDSTTTSSLKVVLSSYWPDDEGLAALRGSMAGLDSRLCIQTISGSQEFL